MPDPEAPRVTRRCTIPICPNPTARQSNMQISATRKLTLTVVRALAQPPVAAEAGRRCALPCTLTLLSLTRQSDRIAGPSLETDAARFIPISARRQLAAWRVRGIEPAPAPVKHIAGS